VCWGWTNLYEAFELLLLEEQIQRFDPAYRGCKLEWDKHNITLGLVFLKSIRVAAIYNVLYHLLHLRETRFLSQLGVHHHMAVVSSGAILTLVTSTFGILI
jgi:hypothetical protein